MGEMLVARYDNAGENTQYYSGFVAILKILMQHMAPVGATC